MNIFILKLMAICVFGSFVCGLIIATWKIKNGNW